MTEPLPQTQALSTMRELQNEAVRGYVEASTAKNTRRAYQIDWQHFTQWCTQHQEVALPATPDIVARYLTAYASSLKTSTLTRRLASISVAHQIADLETPTRSILVRKTMKGIRRIKAEQREGITQKEAAITEILREFVQTCSETPTGLRNRALLLVGFAGAFRRSELVNLDIRDLKFTTEGMIITVRTSKTDQEGEGMQKGIPMGRKPQTCPVRALKSWRDDLALAVALLVERELGGWQAPNL
jgi:site-specific recombinase XerD